MLLLPTRDARLLRERRDPVPVLRRGRMTTADLYIWSVIAALALLTAWLLRANARGEK